MNPPGPKTAALCLGVSFLLALPAAAQVFVSPAGSDSANGTREHPVATLDRARDLARTATSSRQVVLADGTYRLSTPLTLAPQDSGIAFQAAPGAHPVLSGALRVTGWRPVDSARNLWQAPAPAGLQNTRQLYVNGIRTHRASGRVPVTLTMTATGYVAADATMSHWKNPTDIEFVYTGGNSLWSEPSEGLGSWTEPRCPIAAIDGVNITMAQPCWDNSTRRVMLPSGERTANLVGPKSVGKQPEYVENAFELLGTPGQWYFDRSASIIYYVPRPGEDMARADVEVPVLDTLIDVKGTAAQPVHDVTFSGIEFAYATWLGPSGPDGFSEIQANYQVTGDDGYAKQALCQLVPGGRCPYGDWTREPGNIRVSGGRKIRFQNDVFEHLGAAALDLGEGTQDSSVEGCVFTDISGNGVQLGGVSAPLADESAFTRDNRIENNLIRNIGAEYRGGIGIVIGYAIRTSVAHNQLDHLPYAGISIGWGGWPDKIKMPGQANHSSQNVLSSNVIHDFMLVLSDGGGIYTQGRTGHDLSDGEKVTGNVIYDQYSSGHGIYTDNGSAMITIRDNVVFHTNHDNINSRHRDYYDGQTGQNFDPLAFQHNWWQQGDPDSDKEQVSVEGNHILASLADAPAALRDQAGLQAGYKALLARKLVAAPPEAPSRVAAYGLNGSAYVTWSPPVFDGGSEVTGFTVTASDGQHLTVSARDFFQKAYVKMDGLRNDQTYTFTVTATNANGASSASLPSRPVAVRQIAVEPPAAPADVHAFRDGDRVSLHFQSPEPAQAENGLPPIVAYAVTVQPGGRKIYFTGRNVITLQGTKHGTFGVVDHVPAGPISISIAAINAAGEGAGATVSPVPVSK